MRSRCLLEIERYEQCKYHRLYEPHKHFKEIEWDKEDISEWESFGANFRCDPEHDAEENRSGKYISEETKRKCQNTDEFTDQVKPSNKHIYNLVHDSLAVKVEYVMQDITENTMETDHDHV